MKTAVRSATSLPHAPKLRLGRVRPRPNLLLPKAARTRLKIGRGPKRKRLAGLGHGPSAPRAKESPAGTQESPRLGTRGPRTPPQQRAGPSWLQQEGGRQRVTPQQGGRANARRERGGEALAQVATLTTRQSRDKRSRYHDEIMWRLKCASRGSSKNLLRAHAELQMSRVEQVSRGAAVPLRGPRAGLRGPAGSTPR